MSHFRRREQSALLPRQIFSTFLLIASLLCAAVPPASAQTDYGRLTIVVEARFLDTQGAGSGLRARVTLTDGAKPERACTVTLDATTPGRCVFRALEPGVYAIAVTPDAAAPVNTAAENFTFGSVSAKVNVASGQRLTRTVAVIVEEVTQALVAPPPPVPTPEPTPGPVVDETLRERSFPERQGVSVRASEEELRPGGTRRFESVLETQAGAVNTGDAGSVIGFSLFGQPDAQNVLRTGGISVLPPSLNDTSYQDTGALIFNVKDRESIKDYGSFSASTNNTPAKLGTGTGGQLIKDIKGGGDKHKGELYNYFADDSLNARNFFDFARKPELSYNLFGFKLGGPLGSKFAYFVNYEGIRAHSGHVIFEAAPSVSLRGHAAAAVLPLFDSYRAGGAVAVEGASSDPANFDILRLDATNKARKDAVTTRFDYTPGETDALSFIYLGGRSSEDTPDGVSGRRLLKRDRSQTAIFNYTHSWKRGDDVPFKNQFIVGLKSDPSRLDARLPAGGASLSGFSFVVGGKVGQTAVPGFSPELSLTAPGGLLRDAGNFKGRELRFAPSSVSIINQLTWSHSDKHTFTFGGEVRLLRTALDRRFGTTYEFASLEDFLTNRLKSTAFVGDLGSFTGDAAGVGRKARQEYYIAYAQDAYKPHHRILLTYGLRYEYYSVLREARDRAVVFDPDAGTMLPPGTPFYRSRRNNFLPRVAFAWSLKDSGESDDPVNAGPTVISASFGMHVGPDALDTILRPIYSDSISATQAGGAFPVDTGALAAAFASNPEGRRFLPLAIARDFSGPARVYKFDALLKQELLGRKSTGTGDNKKILRELFLTLGYSGSRGRNLPVINFGNPVVSVETNPDPTQPAIVRRRFDLDRGGLPVSPFGEVEFFTSGGRSQYDSFQATLTGVSTSNFLQLLEMQYTLASNRGDTDPDSTIGVGHPSNLAYDFGYNSGDVRHKFSFAAVFMFPCEFVKLCQRRNSSPLAVLFADWTVAAVGSFQTGQPIDLRLRRPDVVYVDASGRVFNSPAAGLRAVANVPGGGSTVAAFRPDLVPGADPFAGVDRQWLNPAAFAIPAPGAFGSLRRGDLRGPGVRLVDISLRKEFYLRRPKKADDAGQGGESALTLVFNADVNNIFNFTNFKYTSATLPDALGLNDTGAKVQPGQPFTDAAAGADFGVITRTYKRKQDLSSSRQIQFRLSFQF
jgi:hypothetical protein